MKFLEKVKSFMKAPFSKKEREQEDVEIKELQDLNKEISLYIVDKLTQYSIDPPNTPKRLTPKQWRGILNQMIWAWHHAYFGQKGSTIKHQKINKLRLLIGFKLFVRYFKDIK